MFASVRQYTYNPQNAVEINRRVREKVVPRLRHLPGFLAYYWMDSGAGTGAAWIVFETEPDARAGMDAAQEIFQAPLCCLLGKPQVTQGQVIAFTNAGL